MKFSGFNTIIISIIMGLNASALFAADANTWGNWSNPPSNQANNSLTTHHTFFSELIGTNIGYTLYLPPGTNSNDSLPVIYWLHGKSGNETRGAFIAGFLDEAIRRGQIRPTAMVLVNGGLVSFYTDSFDGRVPVDSMIINELIPHVENTHPISNQPALRMLEGFSMGGFGALKFATKYPGQFNSVSINGAALRDQDNLPRAIDAEAFQDVFNSSVALFTQNAPRFFLENNRDLILQSNLKIRMRAGSEDGTRRLNDVMQSILDRLNIPYDYAIVNGVGHNNRQYYETDNGGSFVFHEQAMQQSEGSAPLPPIVIDEPPIVVEEPPAVNDPPVVNQPPIVVEEPPVVNEPPVITEEVPPIVNQPPIVDEQLPNNIQPDRNTRNRISKQRKTLREQRRAERRNNNQTRGSFSRSTR